jgi:Zn-dependent peptidase ImmA (M78 family)
MAMFIYRDDESLEAEVRKFRTELGMEFVERPDILTIIAKVKHNDKRFNYRRTADAQLPHDEARWDSDAHEIEMRESVFVGIQAQKPRDRFTVAHELSHYRLGHRGLLNRTTNQLHKDISSAQVRHQENEANRFAPMLLAPEYLIPEGATAEFIADTFGLSAPAAVLRKEEVERLRRRRRGELRPLPESIAEFLREAKRQGHDIKTKLD